MLIYKELKEKGMNWWKKTAKIKADPFKNTNIGKLEKNIFYFKLASIGTGAIITLLLIIILFKHFQTPSIKIGTGSQYGTYAVIGKELSSLLSKSGKFKTDILQTEGSLENMEKVASEHLAIAFCQQETPKMEGVRSIAKLYDSMVQIIARKDSGITSIHDIHKNTVVSIGPHKSGTQSLAKKILKNYGIVLENIKIRYLSFDQVIREFQNKKVDLAFITAGIPTKAVKILLDTGTARLLSIERSEALSLMYPSVKVARIPVGFYGGKVPKPPKEIKTIATTAVLITSKNVNSYIIYEVTKTIFENKSTLLCAHPRAISINEAYAHTNLRYPLHKGARNYYERKKPPLLFPGFWEVLFSLASLLCILFGGLLSWKSKHKQQHFLENIKEARKIYQTYTKTPTKENQKICLEKLRMLKEESLDHIVNKKVIPHYGIIFFENLLSSYISDITETHDISIN